MSYAVRNDMMGFRAVSDPSEVGPGETYSVGVPILNPPPQNHHVDDERDRRIKTFTFQGKVFDFIDKNGSSDNIAGAATLALGAIIAGKQPGDLRWSNPQADFGWIAHDNTVVMMDAQTTFALGQAAASWKSAHIFAGRVIKNMSPIPADYADNARWPA